MVDKSIYVNPEVISRVARKWKIVRLALFGSVLTDHFTPESDIDLLVDFNEDADWDLWDLLGLRDELKGIFGREVDLVERKALTNPFRRRSILENEEVLYAA